MTWRIEYDQNARKELSSLDKTVQRRIVRYLNENLATSTNPRVMGAALTGPRFGAYWKYRIGNYRVLCDIQDETITILAVKIGNRREVYR